MLEVGENGCVHAASRNASIGAPATARNFPPRRNRPAFIAEHLNRAAARLDAAADALAACVIAEAQAIGTIPAGPPRRRVAAAKVRRCRGSWHHGEYAVRAYDQAGRRWPEADYFTNDREDAEQTAARMIRPTE